LSGNLSLLKGVRDDLASAVFMPWVGANSFRRLSLLYKFSYYDSCKKLT